jgi:hypothetical protein
MPWSYETVVFVPWAAVTKYRLEPKGQTFVVSDIEGLGRARTPPGIWAGSLPGLTPCLGAASFQASLE